MRENDKVQLQEPVSVGSIGRLNTPGYLMQLRSLLGLSCEDLKGREIVGKNIGAGKPFRGSLLCLYSPPRD
jgi:hypothetical protein